jgi:hypothetical protein
MTAHDRADRHAEGVAIGADISDRLHRAAHEQCEGLLWLTVDGASPESEPLPDSIQRLLDGDEAQPVRLRHPGVDPSFEPKWVVLDTRKSAGSFALQDSIERAISELTVAELKQGKGRRIGGWLFVDADVGAATRHWARQMIQRRPGGGTTLLRLHDPAVLWALWSLLSTEDRSQLLGPVSRWWLLDPQGGLASLASSSAGIQSTWAVRSWDDIDLIAPLNAALRESERLLPLKEARDAAFDAMRRARQLGFGHVHDLTAFAIHAMTMHPMFDRHPAIAQVLQSRQADDRYTALIEAVDEAAWERVRQENGLA